MGRRVKYSKEYFAELAESPRGRAAAKTLQFMLKCEEALQAKGMNYSDLAKAMGASSAYISQLFEKNLNPTLLTLERLAKALDLSFEFAFSECDSALASYITSTCWQGKHYGSEYKRVYCSIDMHEVKDERGLELVSFDKAA
ncbi:MAG: helix-turn-helix transcriptional regulator [bacterium]|jgi:transcriptional regulator with XRE-family HTH domain